MTIRFLGFHNSLFTGSYSDDFGERIQFYLDTNEQTVLSELNLWHAILKKKNEEDPKNSLEALSASRSYFQIFIVCCLSCVLYQYRQQHQDAYILMFKKVKKLSA